VIGSNSGEIPRVIGNAGLVFHEGDGEALAQCVRRLMVDPEVRSDFGDRGRERVLEHFTHARIAQQTVDLYNVVLSGRACA